MTRRRIRRSHVEAAAHREPALRIEEVRTLDNPYLPASLWIHGPDADRGPPVTEQRTPQRYDSRRGWIAVICLASLTLGAVPVALGGLMYDLIGVVWMGLTLAAVAVALARSRPH